ncbi:MAG: cysteine--tRNA ligase, partial [Actinomycetes bacterium]
MSLYLHDTSTRTVREFVPVKPGRVSIYLCGATVQAPPHIGHIRSGVNFDVLRRWLTHLGYDVWLCRNVTDIDDKIIRVAAEEGVPWFVVAERNYRHFTWAYDALGCLPPTVEPRATGHIPEMIELMARLIDKGHAYAAGGDVYFDVRSYADRYGELSNQKLENMRPAADTDTDTHKRDPRDFALWKAAKPGEPTWRTPWGPGRPGWHLECSAMATKYLGSTFDIHGGGVDLLFPHHENEQAQSRAAGDGFARYWLHNGLLTLGGEKMSKSLGNSLLVSEMLKVVRAVELRYYLVSAHYRSPIEYSEEALQEAATAYRRIEGFVTRAAEIVHDVDKDVPLPQAFVDAMNNDIGTPQAIAAIHESVREGNAALAQGNKDRVARILAETEKMLDILGLNPRSEQWRTAGDDTGLRDTVDALVSVVLEQRQAARARKDYATADAIR